MHNLLLGMKILFFGFLSQTHSLQPRADLAAGHRAPAVSASERRQLFLAAWRTPNRSPGSVWAMPRARGGEQPVPQRSGGEIPAGVDVARGEPDPAMPGERAEPV